MLSHILRLGGLPALLWLVAVALPGAMSAASAPASPPGLSSRVVPYVEPDERFAERVLSRAPSVFEHAQVVSFYGYPGVPAMGALGGGSPERVADEIASLAAAYDALNGDRDVIPALHLIVAVAQPRPRPDGSYLKRMPDEMLNTYVELARERGMLLFLDIQIGWADPLEEVRLLADILVEPFVHVALDPEFATRALQRAPGDVIGRIDPAEVNSVQEYLATLVREYSLPPKVLVLHQFVQRMLPNPEQYAELPEVELTVDMDGYGGARSKLTNYQFFALAAYSERSAIKLFFDWDEPLLSPERLLSLDSPPDLVIYQ